MTDDIVIVGAGGMAREVAWLIEEINQVELVWNLLGFVELDSAEVGKRVGNYQVIMSEQDLISSTDSLNCVIGIGNPSTILRIISNLSSNLFLRYPNLVHPGVCWDQKRIKLGVGNIICAGNILTTDIKIGSYNIFNTASTCGHDVEIKDCNVINPGASIAGSVKIGTGCLIGTRAAILQKITIGDNVIVGGGAVVTRNVSDNLTIVGVAAKPMFKD